MKKIFVYNIFILVWLFVWMRDAVACSVCFGGNPNDPAIVGIKMGIFLLLGVLLVVFSLFIQFFINIVRRSKMQGKNHG